MNGGDRNARTTRWDPHRALGWLALAVCVLFAIHGVHAGLRDEGSDFTIYYDAARAVLSGVDPGDVPRFLYLPSFALLLAPLAVLPYGVALALWQVGSLATLAWIVRTLPRLVALDGGRPTPWLAWLPLLATLRLVDSNLSNGQTNLLVLGAVIAALQAWLGERPIRAGVWLALATGLKVLPAALVAVWIVRGERRALVGFAVAGLALLFAPSVALGIQGNLDALRNWWHAGGSTYAGTARELLAHHANPPGQSLLATAFRLLCDSPNGTPALVASWEPERVLLAVRCASLAIGAALLALLLHSSRRNAPLARLREFALVMGATLAVAPLVHKAHLCWLLLSAALLALDAPPGLGTTMRRIRLAAALVGAGLIGLTTPWVLGSAVAPRALEWNAAFFGLAAWSLALALETWCATGPGVDGSGTVRGHDRPRGG